ncbi:MAG: malonyl-CoA decarboxylase [Pseudomonadota bacterium]|nr:malonyl-CoA decarboxylase [Pseudomonadota bacterium]
MSTSSIFSDMLQTITERGRRLLSLGWQPTAADGAGDFERACENLLSRRGEASGMALAGDILERWLRSGEDERRAFMLMMLDKFGPDAERLERAIEAYREERSPATLRELHAAAEPRRQELIRRLNLAPNGIATLVRMREALLRQKAEQPDLEAVDADFSHLFGSWFNRGFLVLTPIDWSAPANILEKIIRYEAVHEIGDWDELRRRLDPEDRRCFAFFHPQLVDEPLIFVEVALTKSISGSISELLGEGRAPIRAEEATTAVFYSISNCQEGLRGISFGNFLIKQVVEELRRELPGLETFATLSPLPGFSRWLASEMETPSGALTDTDRAWLEQLGQPDWPDDPETRAGIEAAMPPAVAHYLLRTRNQLGLPTDPVARFHLGNGARLERVNFLADRSPRAMRQSHGAMVNYLYKLDDIETNHEAFIERGEVVAAPAVKRLLRHEQPGKPQISGNRKDRETTS